MDKKKMEEQQPREGETQIGADDSFSSYHLKRMEKLLFQQGVKAVMRARKLGETFVDMNCVDDDDGRPLTQMDGATVLKGPGKLSDFVPHPSFFNDFALSGDTDVSAGDLIIWEASSEEKKRLDELASKDKGFDYVAHHPQILGIPDALSGRCFVIFVYNGEDRQGDKWGGQLRSMTFLNGENTAFVWCAPHVITEWVGKINRMLLQEAEEEKEMLLRVNQQQAEKNQRMDTEQRMLKAMLDQILEEKMQLEQQLAASKAAE